MPAIRWNLRRSLVLLALILGAGAGLTAAGELTRAPYLQQGTEVGITVRWRTATPGDSVVYLGDQPGGLSLHTRLTGPTTDHAVSVSGLDASTRYYYAVGNGREILAGADADHFFVTAPLSGKSAPTRIWILGDVGSGDPRTTDVRDAYLTFTGDPSSGANGVRHTDLWLVLGGGRESLFEIYPELLRRSVVWTTIGDRDTHDDTFMVPSAGEAGGVPSGTESYYSFDHGNIHFVALDSSHDDLPRSESMLAWLSADLAASGAEWIVAFWHHPSYSRSIAESDDDAGRRAAWMRQNVLPVLEAYGVDVVLSAGTAGFERSYLLDGHYGDASTFVESMKVDRGNGRVAYTKPLRAESDGRDGAVYTVVGSLGRPDPSAESNPRGTESTHPAMVVSERIPGSVVLDVDGTRLDARFVDADGAVRDEYTIVKSGPAQSPIVDFWGAPLQGLAPLTVGFTDASLFGTGRSWDFEDDGTPDSSLPFPDNEYATAGYYSVRLTVSNANGSNELLRERYVCVTDGVPGAVTGLEFAADPATLIWNAASVATDYDLIRGDLAQLIGGGGDYASIATVCLEDADFDLTGNDPTLPATGATFFYLVRATNCFEEDGTWDVSGPSLVASRDPQLVAACVPCTDTDGDGFCDSVDGCPNDPAKSDPGACGCGVADTDTDGDSTADCLDGCVNDPAKIDPGDCGCGVADTDTDGDLTADCLDGCPNDPDKIDPGVCGCGVADVDTDGDLTLDCEDLCPTDPDKIVPGVCGCGVADVDTDNDGALDCEEQCPTDPNKTLPGQCGCGVAWCWLAQDSGVGILVDLESVDFPSGPTVGFVAGRFGTVLRTLSFGTVWDEVNSGTGQNVEAIVFPADQTTGWIVGDAGRIRMTVDTGINWSGQTSPTAENLHGLYFLADEMTGFAVGDVGTILKTTDGGTTWTPRTSGTAIDLESVQFPGDGPVGYIVGEAGTILKSFDGGETWSPLVSGTAAYLEDVYFPADALTGYAVGELGTVLKTTDGGSNWVAQDALTTSTLRGISFPVDALAGYIVGEEGTVRTTDNGGATWTAEDPGTTLTLRDVQFPTDLSNGYAVGDEGTILRRVID